MAAFGNWLAGVLADGESVLAGPPNPTESDRPEALRILKSAFHTAALDVAGPPIVFDAESAWLAARVLSFACWKLVSDDDARFPSAPDPTNSPRCHLSADVTLRFLPSVLNRARTHGEDAPLAVWVTDILRRWPLSGVLADIADPPLSPPNFAGHFGLQMLFAERLATRPRASWLPADGAFREHVERAFREVGKPVPVALSEIPA